MRIVEAVRFGEPDVLVAREVTDLTAGPGEAVVGVAVTDVIYVETQIRSGWGRDYFTVEPPYVPGGAFTGHVLSVGADVDPGWVGRRVAARTNAAGGGYAEQAVVAADALIAVPEELGLPEAAAVLTDGPTALGLLDALPLRPGERVLILAAAGGMGTLLVQLAHAAGAYVIGAARGKAKLDLVRELGADAAVDYSLPDWTAQLGTVDLVLDGAGGSVGRAAFAITAPGGRFSAHGAPSGGFAPIEAAEAETRGVALRGIAELQFPPEEVRQLAERALAEAAAGRFRPVIGRSFPLERAAQAHAAIEAREVLGKTLLEVRPAATVR
ncbi:zinc-binding dehydrogenase [Streptomyces sp. NBC_01537]|uniref:zinc-binding dehydrogenase n=1 Tax=Streptomyces sp. NBC_01537 TaxID=2903896 RepID=UPI00386C9A02